ncbi:unnamed protein product, partial [Rotaria magnacalcarata]
MFAIRQYSCIILSRSYSSYFIRYQSTKSTDLAETSPSDIERKSTVDYSLWATSETNQFINYLSNRIKTIGPITVADFMRESLLHPKY